MAIQLDRVGWEDGTLVTPARVTTSTGTYDVTEAQYSGTTPLSAENLKAMEDNVQKVFNELQGTVLYENAEGIDTGNFTINDDLTNYKRIKIYELNGCCLGEYDVAGLLSNLSNAINLSWEDQGQENLYIKVARLMISGRIITFYSNARTFFNGNTWQRDNLGLVLWKVIGYKY